MKRRKQTNKQTLLQSKQTKTTKNNTFRLSLGETRTENTS